MSMIKVVAVTVGC